MFWAALTFLQYFKNIKQGVVLPPSLNVLYIHHLLRLEPLEGSSDRPPSGGFYNELESGGIYSEFVSGGIYRGEHRVNMR